MAVNVFSKNWYRVSHLKPKLKSQVDISSQRHRNERCYVLRDAVSGEVQRFSAYAYSLIGFMDGSYDLNELWEMSSENLREEMPTQEELIGIVSALYRADMLHLNIPANAADLFTRRKNKKQKKLISKLYSPLSLQIPLFDPTSLLDRVCPVVSRFLGVKLLVLYVLILCSALLVAFQNVDGLTGNLADRILAVENLLLLWLLYPIIKIFHELGHAFVIRYFGGQVSEVGIMFLVFFPMPYVNAIESASFDNKYHRIAVSSAGVVVELFVAALAIIGWSFVEPGLLKSILFNVAFMAGVSTLLFNGNPLLKFDAYYVLSDFLEIPNLASKATMYWGYLFKKYLFGIRDVESPAVDRRERYWLFFYNLASFIYRLFISITIVLFVGSKYFVLGVILAIWSLVSAWLLPLGKTLMRPFREVEFKYQGRNPVFVMLLSVFALWIILFELPLPRTMSLDGVVWLKEENRLYADEAGFVDEILIANGDQVEAGNVLIKLKSFKADQEVLLLEKQRKTSEARLQSVYNDRSKYQLVGEELSRIDDLLEEARYLAQKTRVVSKSEGTVILQSSDELLGRFLNRGELVGYVLDSKQPLLLKVMIPEGEAEKVLTDFRSVDVRPTSDYRSIYGASLGAVTPGVTQRLPSPILSDQAGGEIVLNPTEREEGVSIENYLVVNIVSNELSPQHVEERYKVRFELSPEPVFWRVYRVIRRTLLQYFDV